MRFPIQCNSTFLKNSFFIVYIYYLYLGVFLIWGCFHLLCQDLKDLDVRNRLVQSSLWVLCDLGMLMKTAGRYCKFLHAPSLLPSLLLSISNLLLQCHLNEWGDVSFSPISVTCLKKSIYGTVF